MKIAIIHDWLTGMRGGEKCLEVFCELFPDATLFTLLHKKGSVSDTIEKMDIRTSFLQKIPGIDKKYRSFLPFFTKAIESFDLTGFDLVLSSSHCVAKGVKSSEQALHVCYCYTPVRYAWKFFDAYFSNENMLKRWIISKVLNDLKKWDLATNKRIDYFIAISDNIKQRINNYYNREADVIYPPCEVGSNTQENDDKGYYLIVSALVPYKKVDLAVESFKKSGKRLVVIGEGTEFKQLKNNSSKNIEFLGWVGEKELTDYYSNCTALIFPGEEDFGIVPVEAQAYGKPVIAYAAGGALETVIPFDQDQKESDHRPWTMDHGQKKYPTGVFFSKQTEESLNDAVDRFESIKNKFDSSKIKESVLRFSRERFKKEIREYVERKWKEHVKKM